MIRAFDLAFRQLGDPKLRARKLSNIGKVDAVATANIGCLHHLSGPDAPPVLHLAELIDWADGGALPAVLR